jgi:DNA (cytosine-5)-methyltransferase 1
MQQRSSSATTVIELFCGIGGFRTAADRLGLKTVWANDLSPSACAVYRDRFGSDILHEGDINQLSESVPDHEILTAGFPCQPFSAAGKKEGTRDPRGTLFQAIVDVVRKKDPRHFVLENVKRLLSMEHGAHFATVLSALSALNYFIEWRVLNAKDFGLAQNRERVVILGTRMDSFSFPANDIRSVLRLASPNDLLSAPRGTPSLLARPDSWKPLERHGAKFPFWGVAMNGGFFSCNLDSFSAALPSVKLREILESAPPSEYDLTELTLGRLQHNEAVDRYVHGVEIISNQAGGARMGYTIFGIGGIAPTLTASTSRHYERYKVGDQYRRLTPREYARLQGFPDDHCCSAKRADQYLLYGNAVPPPLVEWVLRQITEERSGLLEPVETHQRELFYA